MEQFTELSKSDARKLLESRLNKATPWSTFNRWIDDLNLSGDHKNPKTFYSQKDVDLLFHFASHLGKFRNRERAITYAFEQVKQSETDQHT